MSGRKEKRGSPLNYAPANLGKDDISCKQGVYDEFTSGSNEIVTYAGPTLENALVDLDTIANLLENVIEDLHCRGTTLKQPSFDRCDDRREY